MTMALRVASRRLFQAVNARSSNVMPVMQQPDAAMSTLPELEYVKVESAGTDGRVGLVSLNRPKALNALCSPLMDDLMTALR